MKQKKQAQIADKICFSNPTLDSKKLIEKGKLLTNQLPNSKAVNSILQKCFGYIVQPKPFRTLKTSKINKRNDLNSNLQYIEKLKLCHFNRDVIAQTKKEDTEFIPQTKIWRNQLILTSIYQDKKTIDYVLDNSLRSIQWTYDHHDHQFDIVDYKENQLQLSDQTGIYQMIKFEDILYLKHLYQVELVQNYESIKKYSSQNMINQILFQHNLKQLYILTKESIRTEDKIVKQFQTQLSEPYIIQSMHLHYNPRALFLSSFREIQLFDLRKPQLNTLISIDVHELLTNRIYSMHQFQESQYIMVSTNQDLLFYDLRNLKCPFSKQKHGCMENPIQEFISITEQTIDLSLIKKIENFHSPPSSDTIIGYSNRGHAICIEFNSGIVKSAQDFPSLRTCSNLIYDNSLQYGSDNLVQNGQPMLIGTSGIHSTKLKTRGFQFCYNDEKYFVFSLDNQGGLGLQVFDQNLHPLLIKNNGFDISKILMVECEQQQNNVIKENSYDEIFDEFSDLENSSLELQEIEELQPKVKKIKLSNFEINSHEFNPKIKEDNLDFEGDILNNNEDNSRIEADRQCKSNSHFIITPEIIHQLLNNQNQ